MTGTITVDGLTVSEGIAKPVSAFESAMQEIRADFIRLTGQFTPLGDCVPFSPQAYNAISAVILESLYTCIEQIAALSDNIHFYSNLGVILYCELHHAACTHYFQEYERIYGFVNSRPEPGRPVARRPASPRQLLRRATGKVSGIVQNLAGEVTLRDAPRVGWAGSTTFPWPSLASQLSGRGIRLLPVKTKGALSIPAFADQVKILELWVQDLHQKLADTFGVGTQVLRGFGADEAKTLLRRLSSLPAMENETYDLVVTGTLGHLRPRVVAIQARSRGIPVLTLHHGAHYFIFNEPYHALYEDALPDVKVVYGSIEEQRNLGTLGKTVNLGGRSIQLYSRSDPNVQRLFREGGIRSLSSLDNLIAVYIANNYMGLRYGPYRDVHPSTYLAWQEQLLAWLEKQTGRRPLVRLHPKRPSTRYDPAGYEFLNGDMSEVLNLADVFVIDYPTTPLAYIAATDKPILFFDIGLRRLHPAALEAVRGRCHYAAVDLLCPDEGFAAMEADLSRQYSHTFTPIFSLAPGNREEVATVADAVCSVLSQQG